MPVITNLVPSTKTVEITWMQDDVDSVDSFFIDYTFTVTGCAGVDGRGDVTLQRNALVEIQRVNDEATYQYMVTGLQEHSDVRFTMIASGVGGATVGNVQTVLTLQAGRWLKFRPATFSYKNGVLRFYTALPQSFLQKLMSKTAQIVETMENADTNRSVCAAM